MRTAPAVSVVIPCFNSRLWIEETLESVRAQQLADLEIILVDDGSADGSADFIESRFPDVTIYRNTNQGPSAARNFGTAQSHGEFIQYLDADDLLAPGKLQAQLALLQSTNADMAYGHWNRFRTAPDGSKVVLESLARRLGTEPDLDFFTGFWCPTGTYLIRRSLIDRTAGWLPRFPVIQDARFMLDCALHGARFVYCDSLMAEYRTHTEGSVSTRSRTAFLDDCLRNALEIRDLWTDRGELNPDRRKAVIQVLDMVANGSVGLDENLFGRACDAIGALPGGYPSDWPLKKKSAVAFLGYRSSIAFAHRLRQHSAR
jgi:glycosyltransferase involved in cell wall biosynthesis